MREGRATEHMSEAWLGTQVRVRLALLPFMSPPQSAAHRAAGLHP